MNQGQTRYTLMTGPVAQHEAIVAKLARTQLLVRIGPGTATSLVTAPFSMPESPVAEVDVLPLQALDVMPQQRQVVLDLVGRTACNWG